MFPHFRKFYDTRKNPDERYYNEMKNKMLISNRVDVPSIRQSFWDGVAVFIPGGNKQNINLENISYFSICLIKILSWKSLIPILKEHISSKNDFRIDKQLLEAWYTKIPCVNVGLTLLLGHLIIVWWITLTAMSIM